MIKLPSSPDDFALMVASGVQSRSHGRVRDLKIELAEQMVVMRGRVATYHAKQLAQSGALDMLEEHQLINEIVVG
jgi:hypothetical protein